MVYAQLNHPRRHCQFLNGRCTLCGARACPDSRHNPQYPCPYDGCRACQSECEAPA